MRRPTDRLASLFYAASGGRRRSKAIGRLSDVALPRPVLERAMAAYRAAFGISMDDVVVPPGGFRTFNEFFTRRLRPDARPVDPDSAVVTSPADGRILAQGTVERGRLLQAKGQEYAIGRLLCDEHLCARLEGGPFVSIYLSPRDYHRVHFPCGGRVVGSSYAPGRLLTVAPRAVASVDSLLATNERITTIVEGDLGLAAIVMVGAVGVGRITMTYGGLRTNADRVAESVSFDPPVPCAKGDELGVFNLGSTVVLALGPGAWTPLVAGPGTVLRMGQPLFRRG